MVPAAKAGPSVLKAGLSEPDLSFGALGWDYDHEFNCVLFSKESHFPKIGNKWRHSLPLSHCLAGR